MRIIHTVSVDRFAKARKISDCAHENVEDLCNDCIDDHRELLAAKACDEESTMHMLDTIGTAGSRSGDDMKSEIRPIRKKLHAALLTTRWMKPEDRAAHMVSAGVDVMTILNELKEECRRLCDGDKWGPAKNMSDKKTLSKNFGSVNKAETGMVDRVVNAVIQRLPSGGSKGKVDPKRSDSRGNRQGKPNGFRPGKSGQGKGRGRRDARSKTPDFPPPSGPNVPETMKDPRNPSRTLYWCGSRLPCSATRLPVLVTSVRGRVKAFQCTEFWLLSRLGNLSSQQVDWHHHVNDSAKYFAIMKGLTFPVLSFQNVKFQERAFRKLTYSIRTFCHARSSTLRPPNVATKCQSSRAKRTGDLVSRSPSCEVILCKLTMFQQHKANCHFALIVAP